MDLVMVLSILAAAVFLAMMSRAGRAMRRTGGPGIVPFELAESPREADRLMRAWGPAGRRAARRSIGWDYGFIATYVLLLAAAAVHVAADAPSGWLRAVEWGAAILAVLTGLLDCVENLVMLRELRLNAASPVQITVSRTCAQLKFLCAGLVGIVVLVGFGIVELSGHPTSTRTILALSLATAVGGAVFLVLRRTSTPPVADTAGLFQE